MTTPAEWSWTIRRGRAGELHELSPPETVRRTVHEMVVDEPVIVLGSSQAADDIDMEAAQRMGISVARRRSGGGAVLLVPGAHVWLDVWLPSSDPLWVDDVGIAGEWLAEVWNHALTGLGFSGIEVHRGGLEPSDWSPHVCFAGLGPGEVTNAGRKLVGVSQRRTRDWARFQCLVHRRWDAATTFALLSTDEAADASRFWSDAVAEIGDSAVTPAVASALTRLT